MLKPPQHRIDAPIILIHETDDAWDHDRIIREAKENPSHVVRQYWRGDTRFDLTAEVQQYLKPGATPTRFILRRISWEDYQRCVQKVEANEWRAAFGHACLQGLVKIENGPINIEGASATWFDLQKLHEASTAECDLVRDVGFAVYKASAPLNAAEKKV